MEVVHGTHLCEPRLCCTGRATSVEVYPSPLRVSLGIGDPKGSTCMDPSLADVSLIKTDYGGSNIFGGTSWHNHRVSLRTGVNNRCVYSCAPYETESKTMEPAI